MAKSTADAEYIALGEAASEAIWLRQFVTELGLGIDASIKIHVDNKAAIDIAHNPKFHNRTKHIDVQYHFVRDHIEKGSFKVEKVKSTDNTADLLTKLFSRVHHEKHVRGLGFVSTRGSVVL